MMWFDPNMAVLVAIQRRNDALERERQAWLREEIPDPEPSQSPRNLWESLRIRLSAAITAPWMGKGRLQGERK